MPSRTLEPAQQLKIAALASGVQVTQAARQELSQHGTLPLSVYEYATTAGVTFAVGDVFVNAAFDEWYSKDAVVTLDYRGDSYVIDFEGHTFAARGLPLPGYLDETDASGQRVTDTIMSHADRARLSPIDGCALRCQFCDMIDKPYRRHGAEQCLAALQVALEDPNLPIRHLLISGGTPGPAHEAWMDSVFEQIIRESPVPVDVMMTPRSTTDVIDQLVEWGVHSLSLNIEIFGEETGRKIVRGKAALGKDAFRRSIERASELLGPGRIRSLILVGLEPIEDTLAGVEWLASMGCDPVLSPFRPTKGTPLENSPPPSRALLEQVYVESCDIAERHGVKLGPRCLPCQHNTLTLPDGSDDYFYW